MKPNREKPPAAGPNLGAPQGVRSLSALVEQAKRAGRTTTDLIVLHPRCHPGAPVIATYWASAGALVLECCECREPVCQIAVAG